MEFLDQYPYSNITLFGIPSTSTSKVEADLVVSIPARVSTGTRLRDIICVDTVLYELVVPSRF